MKTLKKILSNEVVKFILIFITGCVIGVMFYPTKTVTVEKEKVVVKYIKADHIEQKPDGTIVASGNATLDSHDTTSEYSKTEINKKRFLIEAGALLNQSYYVHFQANIVSRFFIGVHTQLGKENTVGAGIGFEF